MTSRQEGMLSDAYFLGERVSWGKTDLRGRPAVMHMVEVAAAVTQYGIHAMIVAFLHDFYENGGVGELVDFPPFIREAVDAVNRHDTESYRDYIARVAENELARKVKLADLRLNLATCPRASLRERYELAIARLARLEREAEEVLQ